MTAVFYNFMGPRPTSTITTNYYEFKPKHRIEVSWVMQEEIFEWVRECCSGGFQLTASPQTYGVPFIHLASDADYDLFLLRWFDHVIQ
jgi:hypothetical protein